MNYSHPSSVDDFTREFWLCFSAVCKEYKETKEKRERDYDKGRDSKLEFSEISFRNGQTCFMRQSDFAILIDVLSCGDLAVRESWLFFLLNS